MQQIWRKITKKTPKCVLSPIILIGTIIEAKWSINIRKWYILYIFKHFNWYPPPKLILRTAFQHTSNIKYPVQKKATVPIMFFYMYSISRMHKKNCLVLSRGIFVIWPWLSPPLVKLHHFAKNYCIYLWQKKYNKSSKYQYTSLKLTALV